MLQSEIKPLDVAISSSKALTITQLTSKHIRLDLLHFKLVHVKFIYNELIINQSSFQYISLTVNTD